MRLEEWELSEYSGRRPQIGCEMLGVRDRERTSRETGKEMKVKPKRDFSGQ